MRIEGAGLPPLCGWLGFNACGRGGKRKMENVHLFLHQLSPFPLQIHWLRLGMWPYSDKRDGKSGPAPGSKDHETLVDSMWFCCVSYTNSLKLG